MAEGKQVKLHCRKCGLTKDEKFFKAKRDGVTLRLADCSDCTSMAQVLERRERKARAKLWDGRERA